MGTPKARHVEEGVAGKLAKLSVEMYSLSRPAASVGEADVEGDG